ncbi:hypothetical protein MSAN_01732000 [Mycena sanguinolenta]|uniref:Uncharacterized protein n=1 Tax=Mycena sanguinolenta TaxID=230812 RepID=A0A8H7CVE3_9AGAR|nr:hypothetical protein MSAN_01732000 [Mycena sanguinolenta]
MGLSPSPSPRVRTPQHNHFVDADDRVSRTVNSAANCPTVLSGGAPTSTPSYGSLPSDFPLTLPAIDTAPVHHAFLWPTKAPPPDGDASWTEGTWIGVDAVSAAFLRFLQLVEFQGWSQLGESAPELLGVLLSNGCLGSNELLAVVDWERLRILAEKSFSRAFTPRVPFNPPGTVTIRRLIDVADFEPNHDPNGFWWNHPL